MGMNSVGNLRIIKIGLFLLSGSLHPANQADFGTVPGGPGFSYSGAAT